jgi:hypothetical protein
MPLSLGLFYGKDLRGKFLLGFKIISPFNFLTIGKVAMQLWAYIGISTLFSSLLSVKKAKAELFLKTSVRITLSIFLNKGNF